MSVTVCDASVSHTQNLLIEGISKKDNAVAHELMSTIVVHASIGNM